ncbi:polysaccharide deacetylase [Cryobacterium sp. Y82]|uniref:polysaccharide deacetylase family protein n=1 Tax=Cryobacterium sp. Y82 TaxID=2045017 RepID=UPI000CE4117E|nr:polysaccharide deacetylase [Cryobacterium sp. Y82]
MSKKSSVCVTFDFDAISLWLARKMDTPGPVSRGEFGAHAIPRILRALDARGIPSTFFIPGHTAETYRAQCLDIARAGHELALHGYCHEPVSTLDENAERVVVRRSADILAAISGKDVLGHRTPSFDFTKSTIRIIQELGCEYDSSLMGTDYTPYFARSGDLSNRDSAYAFGTASDVIEVPVSWTLDDYPHLEFVRSPAFTMSGLKSVNDMFESFYQDVLYMTEREPGGVCTLTFHPQVIGRGGRMLALETFLDRIAELPIEFVTCLDAARSARQRLAKDPLHSAV